MKKRMLITGLLLLCSSLAHAATVTYVLDQSNRLEDDVDYLTVTLSDDTEGQLDFLIEPQPALRALAGDNLGILAFAFNVSPDVKLGGHRHLPRWRRGWGHSHGHHGGGWGRPDMKPDDVLKRGDFILPDGWRVKFNRGWGFFDVGLFTHWWRDGADPLQFSILGLTIDDISNEFAALVGGLDIAGSHCGDARHGRRHGCRWHGDKAFIYGGRLSEIPLPPAVWLFGSGLLGLLGLGRKRLS